MEQNQVSGSTFPALAILSHNIHSKYTCNLNRRAKRVMHDICNLSLSTHLKHILPINHEKIQTIMV